eukprot:scaffold5250_cov394-Prasinococcus_capsulatus_cf.AAC.3
MFMLPTVRWQWLGILQHAADLPQGYRWTYALPRWRSPRAPPFPATQGGPQPHRSALHAKSPVRDSLPQSLQQHFRELWSSGRKSRCCPGRNRLPCVSPRRIAPAASGDASFVSVASVSPIIGTAPGRGGGLALLRKSRTTDITSATRMKLVKAFTNQESPRPCAATSEPSPLMVAKRRRRARRSCCHAGCRAPSLVPRPYSGSFPGQVRRTRLQGLPAAWATVAHSTTPRRA